MRVDLPQPQSGDFEVGILKLVLAWNSTAFVRKTKEIARASRASCVGLSESCLHARLYAFFLERKSP